MREPPIKKCDYCEATGHMPTFMNGETMCYDCLRSLPTNPSECRAEIVRLRSELLCLLGGLSLTADAIEHGFHDEALLHCRHHEAKAAKALGLQYNAGLSGDAAKDQP